MDFVHEDMSLMSQEMDRWRALQNVKVGATYITQQCTLQTDHDVDLFRS